MNVFEYMGWCEHIFGSDLKCKKCGEELYQETRHHLDGNDMVLAINKMQEKGDWKRFLENVAAKYFAVLGFAANDLFELFGNPANFFAIMEEWLNEKTD